jgi:putative CRISPR-associated protein (TIGR02619 family)
MMSQVIISTVGTSLLTNQINRSVSSEETWYNQLRDTANLRREQVPQETLDIIETLKERAKQKLANSNIAQIRSASAELNGIYGLYEDQLNQGKQDVHYLIATDTVQGKETATIVQEFLQGQQLVAEMYTPPGLSTDSTTSFSGGIDELLSWLQETIVGFKSKNYRVCFNLVGSFKSLQGYLNTIGMFYADEIIYIFEGKHSEVIRIPRLPVKVDESVIQPYAVEFALMAANTGINKQHLSGVPETLICAVDDTHMMLSTWGSLVWNQAKDSLLSTDLLSFPFLKYEPSFLKDYQSTKDRKERVKLQETLAKISGLLRQDQGNGAALKADGGIQLETYRNTQVDHFRVTLSQRVSCQFKQGVLSLRYYGGHDHVERSEGIS